MIYCLDMNNKKVALVFGASSFLGSHICAALKGSCKVVGTYFENRFVEPDMLSFKCDISNYNLVKTIISLTQPDLVFYCVGINDLYECEKKPMQAEALNSAGLFNVIKSVSSSNPVLIHFSSQEIFSGADRLHLDLARPLSRYGEEILTSENFLRKNFFNHLVLRLPKVYGLSLGERPNLWENLQIAWCDKENRKFTVHSLSYYLPVSRLMEIIKVLIDYNVCNEAINISGTDLMTEYEFAKLASEVTGESNDHILPSSKGFPQLVASQSLQLQGKKRSYRMDSEKLKTLADIELGSIRDELIDYRRATNQSPGKLKLI